MKNGLSLFLWLLLAAVAIPMLPTMVVAKEKKGGKREGLRKKYLAAKALYEKRTKEKAPAKELARLEKDMKTKRRKWRLAIAGITTGVVATAAAVGAAAYYGTKETLPPLHKYAREGNFPFVAQLLEEDEKTTANTKDSSGNTPLHHVAAVPEIENEPAGKSTKNVIGLLLQYNADINAKNNNGYTPLIIALARKNVGAVNLLIEKGANVNLAATWGGTPLFYTLEIGHGKELLQKLIDAGASDTEKVLNHKLAEWALYFGRTEAVEALGASASEQSEWNTSERAAKMRKDMPAKLKDRPSLGIK